MQQYIDKTESLEKGIVVFPFIYIMGASAIGKSVAVWMLCEKHPEVKVHMVDMMHGKKDQMTDEAFEELLLWTKEQMSERPFWLVLENVPKQAAFYERLNEFCAEIPEKGRVILVGRYNVPHQLLSLYWSRKLEVITQASLELSREEVRMLKEMWESPLDADDVWRCTGGWAGCADVLFRASVGKHRLSVDETSAKILMKKQEVVSYIEQFIVGELPKREQQFFEAVMQCPWVNVSFGQEVLGFEDAAELLQSMNRRGFFEFNEKKMRWRVAPLFTNCVSFVEVDAMAMGQWYEKNLHIREALACYEKSSRTDIYESCVMKYFHQIPFLDKMLYRSEWGGDTPQCMYLRGMKKIFDGDFEGVKAEIKSISNCEMDAFQKKEMILNLNYVFPEFSFREWMDQVEEFSKGLEGKKFRLYHIIGNSCTYLCGLRDLSGLFACMRKEESHWAKVWKKAFGEQEWKCYHLARMDYYLETQRIDSIDDEEWRLLTDNELNNVAQIYLLGKAQHYFDDMDYTEQFRVACEEMLRQEDSIRRKTAEAIMNIYSPWMNEPGRLTRWLKRNDTDILVQVNEENYMIVWCMAKGYLLLNQYKKAEKLLKRLIPYLKKYRLGKLLAEAYLQQAIINWETGRRGQSLQNIVESFYISGETRYVALYCTYGKRAKEVLEAYQEWHRTTYPESWSYKKKYPYGNVLRMPMADYIEVILRGVRKESRVAQPFLVRQEELIEERLTMMETLILQEISKGLTNEEISKQQNLKLSTVKTHIYSLYKKLGVNSRVQATIKGKELGLLT